MNRKNIRKLLLIISLLLFPITILINVLITVMPLMEEIRKESVMVLLISMIPEKHRKIM